MTFSDSSKISTAYSLGTRNRLINGGMDIWQRGTSFSNMGSTTSYTADRWSCYRNSYVANCSVSQVTGLTIGTGINRNALRFQRTSGDANTSGITVSQSLESINSRDLAGQTVTISFWARAGANYSSSGNYMTVAVQAGTGTDEAARNGYTGYAAAINSGVTLTTSFQKFSFSGTVPSNCNELSVLFYYNPTGTAGAADYFDITDVQLEPGPVATPFERRLYSQELALCQRYYETISYAAATFYCTSSGQGFSNIYRFAVLKRAAPTITTTYSTTSCTVTAASYVDQVNFPATTTSGSVVAYWNTTSVVTVSAEL
jgi:hypothetical protein